MRLRGRLVDPGDPVWTDVLTTTVHDVYHLPGYATVSAREDGGSAGALVVSDPDGRKLLLPLVIREIDDCLRDATSPYGYPGAIVAGPCDPAFVGEALAEGLRLLRDEGFVSLFIRTHPLLEVPGLESCGVVIEHGRTVAIDLALDEATLWEQTSRNHRQDIVRAEREGLTFCVRDDDAAFEDFKRLYLGTMSWRNAADYYHFDDAYFDALRAVLGPRMHMAVVSIEGRTAAAGIVTTSCGIVQIHLAGWDQDLSHHRPMKVLIHGVRSWAHARHERWLHIGGGRGVQDDGLLRFKLGFSPLTVPFRTVRIVVDDRSYRSLATARDGLADPSDMGGFFPAYRDLATIGNDPAGRPSLVAMGTAKDR
jgi:hypothetical protein